HLQPYESRVLVFSDQAALLKSSLNTQSGERKRLSATIDLGSGWTVTFPRLSRTIQMQQLRSWSEDEETRFYSGEAVYENDFTASSNWLGIRAFLDFGPGATVEPPANRSEEHTSELQSLAYLVCRLLLEKKKTQHDDVQADRVDLPLPRRNLRTPSHIHLTAHRHDINYTCPSTKLHQPNHFLIELHRVPP